MNQGRMFITLKNKRKLTADQVINELSKKFAEVPGATLYMQAAQDLTIGGRLSQAQYQYTLQGEDLNELNVWAPQLLAENARHTAAHAGQHRPAGQRIGGEPDH